MIVHYKSPITEGKEIVRVIVRIGIDVTNYHIGDYIYARIPLDKIGAFVEYLNIDHKEITLVLFPNI